MKQPDPLDELAELIGVLNSDIDEAEALSVAKLKSARRQYVRATFAMLDAVAYSAKQIALHAAPRFEIALTPAEEAVCREESYDIDDRGQVVTRQAFTKWKGNFRFSMDLLARSYGIAHRIDFAKSGWEALQRSLQTRHRLTHPKNSAALSVTQAEFIEVRNGLDWFRKEFQALSHAIADELDRKADPLDAEADAADAEAQRRDT